MNDYTTSQRDKLIADLRSVVADAEEVLKMGIDDLSEGSRGLRDRMQERLVNAKHSLAAIQGTADEKIRAAGHAADDYVHAKPWQSIAVGAGVGVLIGLLIGRR